MKRHLAIITLALSLSSIGEYRGPAAKQNSRVLNLCELVDNWKTYNRQKVRVRAIYEVGAEQTWLYDPACRNGEAVTDVSFQQQVKGAVKRLDHIAAKDRRAWVILEGVFYGPEPFDNIDPKLPASIRERLEKSHKRYGHMDSFDSMIEVTRVVEAAKVTDGPRASKR
jgi:hypothetical protein